MSLVADQSTGFVRSKSRSQSTLWFAAHETRLIWRDFASMMTAGKPHRIITVAFILLGLILGAHWFVAFLLKPAVGAGLVANKQLFLIVSGSVALLFSLMFSQAIESVTRAYYARSDLDLILSSPAPSHRLFEVRTMVLGLQTVLLSMFIASPVINVLMVLDGFHWVATYGVLVALGLLATSLSILLTLGLFRWVGMSRTRLIAQIIAAIVGAGFVIVLQIIAIMFGQGFGRLSFFMSPETVAASPEITSAAWMVSKAAMGHGWAVLSVMAGCGLFFFAVTHFSARRFSQDVLAAAGASEAQAETKPFAGFRAKSSLRAVLRRKEWTLLKRDPWLISQSLQQILYLLPPAFMLWFNYGQGDGIFYVIVPVVVMAAGQLAGGLAWITISGEDAHELIDTSPIAPRTVLRAKVEAVLSVIGIILIPFVVALSFFSLKVVVAMVLGVALASACAVTIQLWFRSQSKRSLFRRRQVSSKAATICEAFVSILWAAAAGVALLNPYIAIVPAVLIAMIMLLAWFIRPPRDA